MGLGLPELIVLIVLIVVVALYFLPTIIAVTRKKRNLGPIILVNLLLGWSVIGWIVAMVWAMATETVDMMPASPSASVERIGRLCAHCGKYSQSDARFCGHCGQSFI